MKTKSLQRAFLLASGLCAVLVILLSQSFYKVADTTSDKKENSKDKTEVAIHAPSDVAAQGQSVELNHTQPVVQEKTVSADQKNEKAVFIQRIATRFFKTLFRAIISPNAP